LLCLRHRGNVWFHGVDWDKVIRKEYQPPVSAHCPSLASCPTSFRTRLPFLTAGADRCFRNYRASRICATSRRSSRRISRWAPPAATSPWSGPALSLLTWGVGGGLCLGAMVTFADGSHLRLWRSFRGLHLRPLSRPRLTDGAHPPPPRPHVHQTDSIAHYTLRLFVNKN
jgi:hypothetical protein